MTPKEKAFELLVKYDEFSLNIVDEIVDLTERTSIFKMRTKRQHVNGYVVDESYMEYWDEVKKEINLILNG